jgi:TonB family protein
MLELKLKPAIGTIPNHSIPSRVEQSQPQKQLLALVLLLITFGALIVKDRAFWFGGGESLESDVMASDVSTPEIAPAAAKAAPVMATHALPAAPAPVIKKKPAIAQSEKAAQPAAGVVATNRAALPPLGVQIISGDKQSRVQPSSNATKLQITQMQPPAPVVNAAERESIATTVQSQAGVGPDAYPMLAQQMKVQGSVVLQAIIGTDGNIQDLRVLAGPSILTAAAEQAVRQWRFKPYFLNGQAVETQATITVNFTIRVNNDQPKNS